MPIQSLLAPAHQAQALCAFLSDASHSLPISVAESIVYSLRGSDKQAAQQLRSVLSGHGVQIKHMHALKAVNVIRGIRTYRAPDQTLIWEVASWFVDAPASSPLRRRCSSLASAADVFLNELTASLDDEEEFLYGRVFANEHSIELTFLGEPVCNQRWLLVCTDHQGNAAQFPVDQQAKLVERVRRRVEGRHGGWLDGAFALQALHLRQSTFRYFDSDRTRSSRYESDIMELLESRVGEGSAGTGQFTNDVFVDQSLLTDEHRFKLLARLCAWSSRYESALSELVAMRLSEQKEGRFAHTKINVDVARARAATLGMDIVGIAEHLEMPQDELHGYVLAGEMPVSDLVRFSSALGLQPSQLHSELNYRHVRMPIDDQMVAMVLSRFEHVEVETDPRYGTPKHLEDQLEALCARAYSIRRREQEAGPSNDFKTLAAGLKAASMEFCLRLNAQFVPDLPLDRERLAQVAALSIVSRAIIEMVPSQGNDPEGGGSEAWGGTDDMMLERLNSADINVKELIDVTREAALMISRGNEPDGEMMMFATARVFRSKPNHAHAAYVRLEAMSRLMENGDLPGWSSPSREGNGMVMASRPVFEAAAVCPLIRVGNRVGFDVHDFRMHMIDKADSNFISSAQQLS